MRGLKVEQVSQGIYERIPSEDVVGYRVREDSLLAWAIDGASTLTERPFTTFSDVTDAGWFARQLSSLLQARFRNMPFSTQLLRLGCVSWVRCIDKPVVRRSPCGHGQWRRQQWWRLIFP